MVPKTQGQLDNAASARGAIAQLGRGLVAGGCSAVSHGTEPRVQRPVGGLGPLGLSAEQRTVCLNTTSGLNDHIDVTILRRAEMLAGQCEYRRRLLGLAYWAWLAGRLAGSLRRLVGRPVTQLGDGGAVCSRLAWQHHAWVVSLGAG